MSRKKKTMDDAIAKGKSYFEAGNAKSIERKIKRALSSKEASAIKIKEVSHNENSRLATLKDKRVRRLKGQEDKKEREKQEEIVSFARSRIDGLIRAYKIDKVIVRAASRGEKTCKVGMAFEFEIDAKQNHLVSGDAWTWDDKLLTPSGHLIDAGTFRNSFVQLMKMNGMESELKATWSKIESEAELIAASVRHRRGYNGELLGTKCTAHGGWMEPRPSGYCSNYRNRTFRSFFFGPCGGVGSKDKAIHCLNIKWK